MKDTWTNLLYTQRLSDTAVRFTSPDSVHTCTDTDSISDSPNYTISPTHNIHEIHPVYVYVILLKSLFMHELDFTKDV